MTFEYRSRTTIAGLPLVHVAFGIDPTTGKRRVARGIFAVGQLALGGVAVGQVAIGAVAVGQLAVGLVGGIGQLALALWALGQVALGCFAGVGQVAAASDASGQHAWSSPVACLALPVAWLVVAGALALLVAPRGERLRRLARALLRGSITTLRPGPVVISGRVIPLGTLESPVSKRPCVAYQLRPSAAGATMSTTPVARACEDFLVEDETGRVRVIAGDAELVLTPRLQRKRHVRAAVGHGDGGPARDTGDHGEYEEVLLAGDHVVVTGTATLQLSGGLARDPRPRIQAIVHGGATGPVVVTNRSLGDVKVEFGLARWLSAAMTVLALVVAVVHVVPLLR